MLKGQIVKVKRESCFGIEKYTEVKEGKVTDVRGKTFNVSVDGWDVFPITFNKDTMLHCKDVRQLNYQALNSSISII